MSEANREQAERAAELAFAALRSNNIAKAVKLFDRSLQMCELPGVREHRNRAAAAAEGEEGSAPPSTPAATRDDGSSRSAGPSRAAGPSQHDSDASHGPSSTNGLHSRAQQHTGSSARPAAAGAASSRRTAAATPIPLERPYTAEQAEAVASVRRAGDYYAVLGVGRDVGGDDVKRAYRKMAVKMHPDKNPAPGADEAFKRINAAFSVLSDPEKKAHYDQFGEADAAAASASSSSARERHYARYEQEISPEDIFNMMFGGGFAGGGGGTVFMHDGRQFRMHTGGRHRNAQHGGGGGGGNEPRDPAQQRMMQLLQLLPLLLLLLFSFSTLFSGGRGENDPVFSLSRSDIFSVPRKTKSYNIVQGLAYFVKEDFNKRVAADMYFLPRVERAVESEFRTSLARQCNDEMQRRDTLARQVRYNTGSRKEAFQKELDKATTEACGLYHQYFPYD